MKFIFRTGPKLFFWKIYLTSPSAKKSQVNISPSIYYVGITNYTKLRSKILGQPQWHNIHTKFHENLYSLKSLYVQTDINGDDTLVTKENHENSFSHFTRLSIHHTGITNCWKLIINTFGPASNSITSMPNCVTFHPDVPELLYAHIWIDGQR